MNRCLDKSVTDRRTNAHTYEGQLIGLPAARPKALELLKSEQNSQLKGKETPNIMHKE